MNTDKSKLKNFVPFPRSVLDDLREGKLTNSEYDLYMRVRHMVGLDGKAAVNLGGLADDMKYRGWSKNNINKLLLELKRKGYLHYDARAGRKGTFKILFFELVVHGGKITSLPRPDGSATDTVGVPESMETSEVNHKSASENQRFADVKGLTKGLADRMTISPGRGSYNDTDKEKEKIRPSYSLKNEIPVREFVVKDHEDEVCLAIATALNERTMNFILGIRRKYGFRFVERAWGIFREIDQSKMENPAKYFNGIVKNLIQNKGSP